MTDLTDLIRQHYEIQDALKRAQHHRFRWVLPKAVHDQFVAQARRQAEANGIEWPQDLPHSPPETLLGMPLRVDEHATTTMLELIR